jgi:secreted trypsin-like serine protease
MTFASWLLLALGGATLACGSAEDRGLGRCSRAAIVGGQPAAVTEFAGQVRLEDASGDLCGGTVIAPSWVLTAGHCVAGVDPAYLTAIVGDLSRTQVEPGEQWLTIAEIFLYPHWGEDDGLVIDNDLALLRLGEPVLLSEEVSPVAVAGLLDECSARTSGWGAVGASGPESDVLLAIGLPLADANECAAYLRSLNEEQLSDRILCAGSMASDSGTCHGDSGGPLVVERGAHTELIGVTIGGNPDCDGYSLFARVGAYVDWIESVTTKSE